MAVSESINTCVTSTVYRNGKAPAASSKGASTARPPFVPKAKASDAWNWMPSHRLALLVEKAAAAAQASCTPPAGESPVGVDGSRFANKSDYAFELVEEITSRLYEAVAGLDGTGPGTGLSVPARVPS